MAGRKKLDRTHLHARVASETPDAIKSIAAAWGFTHNEEGSTGKLLDAIAQGRLILTPSTSHRKEFIDR
jgi:hypothetical protein